MTRHTPGPWQFIAPQFIGTVEEDYQTIAYVDDHRNRKSRPQAEHYANGRLIAESPTMLKALERLAFAALCRETVMGDPCALLAAKAELAAAAQEARDIISRINKVST